MRRSCISGYRILIGNTFAVRTGGSAFRNEPRRFKDEGVESDKPVSFKCRHSGARESGDVSNGFEVVSSNAREVGERSKSV